SARPPAAPRRAGSPRSQGGCVKSTLRVESVRSANETLVWLRLYTDRAQNNRKAVRKTGKSLQSPDIIPAKRESGDWILIPLLG
ncbi:MAG: hypothetical protein L0387_41290, partial [Acidobacteria bacterium]|nr:hypothetical protein [Acidobacteriota bacterium]